MLLFIQHRVDKDVMMYIMEQGGTLKHFSDGPLCKCSLAPISSIKSASACDRHCENYHRVDCFYSPALGCITYAYIDTEETYK